MKKNSARNILFRTVLLIILTTSIGSLLQGCAFALAGAAIGSILIVEDRRTIIAQTEDREIQIKALNRIYKELSSNQAHINVVVFNCHALITGEVQNKILKNRVSDIIRSIKNVCGILNELSIEPVSSLSSRAKDIYLESRVKIALVSNNRVSANYYKVVSERRNIYLLGLVTPDEANRAVEIASNIKDVRTVIKAFQYLS